MLYGLFEEKKVSRIPYIWVDSELSLVRGHVQGFPKKLGDIFMTRPVELGRGGVRKAVGSRFAAHVSALGRRLATLSVTLEATVEKFYPPSVARPPLHTRLFPSVEGDEPSVYEFQRARVADFEIGTVFTGSRHPGVRSVRVQRDRRARAGQCAERLRAFDGVLGHRRVGAAGSPLPMKPSTRRRRIIRRPAPDSMTPIPGSEPAPGSNHAGSGGTHSVTGGSVRPVGDARSTTGDSAQPAGSAR